MTFLVTGATGKAGRHVVDGLLRQGQKVRALTRNPGRVRLPDAVEVVKGDLADPATLEGLFDGVTGVHLLTAAGDDYATLQTGRELVELARKAGVRRATLLWNGHVGPVETAFEDSDLEWTRLEAVDFMGNTLGWAGAVKAEGRVSAAFVDVPGAVVHEADVGAVSARILVEGGHAGKAYSLTGPEALTARERLAVLAEGLGRSLELTELTEAQAREGWRQAGYDEEMIDILAGWQSDPPAAARTVVATVEEITGRPPLTFTQWVSEHVENFQPDIR
ncbi:NAD(P)H-binding protein [Nonomuraea typhae]|uniref:NmrA family NAD(P)-binding protein n=1 Tax=Nonomuraea typhae TaxID=2603600 RepID=UPI0012FB3D9B|nr:NAD(P)H-binding protein [Nonomuraea typhae]